MFGGTQQALRDQNAQVQAPQKEKGRQVPSGPGQDGTHCRVNWVMAFVWLTLHSLSGPTGNKPIVRCWGSHRGRKGHLCLNVYSPVDKRHNSTNNDGVFVCLFWTFPPAGSFPDEFYSSFQTQLQHQLPLLAILSQAELVARLYTECFLYQDPGTGPLLLFSLCYVKGVQSCLTFCDPMDYTVLGILQARILEWVAFPFCSGSSQPQPQPQGSNPGLLHCKQILYQLSHQGSPPPGKSPSAAHPLNVSPIGWDLGIFCLWVPWTWKKLDKYWMNEWNVCV